MGSNCKNRYLKEKRKEEKKTREERRKSIIDQANEPQASGWDLSLKHTHGKKTTITQLTSEADCSIEVLK